MLHKVGKITVSVNSSIVIYDRGQSMIFAINQSPIGTCALTIIDDCCGDQVN